MAYTEESTCDPVVFLHGDQTSSYLWRNVIPHLAGKWQLIGMEIVSTYVAVIYIFGVCVNFNRCSGHISQSA